MDQNGYYYAPQQPGGPNNGKGMATASLVLGIISLAFACGMIFVLPGVLGLTCAIVGLVLAVQARKKFPCSLATAGLVTSIIGTVLNSLGTVSCFACTSCIAAASSSPAWLYSLY